MLSKKTTYALHALVFLGKKYQSGNMSLIGDISSSESIPKKFLESILLDLKKAGILASKKGKGGGYYMIKSPEDVNLSDVVRLMNGPIALLPCVSKNFYEACDECSTEISCGIRRVFLEVRDETLKVLEHRSLKDIMDNYNIVDKLN